MALIRGTKPQVRRTVGRWRLQTEFAGDGDGFGRTGNVAAIVTIVGNSAAEAAQSRSYSTIPIVFATAD